MNRAVLMSTRPKWCAKIAHKIGQREDGTLIYEKSVEVRKSLPKLDVPFKVYIYCTAGGDWLTAIDGVVQEPNTCVLDLGNSKFIAELNGSVIGEFVCTGITYLGNISTDPWERLLGDVHEQHKRLVNEKACLTEKELLAYGGKYGWHISDLVIYDTPRDLSEFRTLCREYDKERPRCDDCVYDYSESNECVGFYEECCCDGLKPIKRPPQSWCYVVVKQRELS